MANFANRPRKSSAKSRKLHITPILYPDFPEKKRTFLNYTVEARCIESQSFPADFSLPLLVPVYRSEQSFRRTCRGKAPPSANADRSVAQTPQWGVCCCHKRKPPVNKKRTRTLFRKESGSSTNCMVDGTGLEPVTSCTSSRCSTS